MQQHAPRFPRASRGASLVLSFRLPARTVVVVGAGALAAARAFACLEADARVVLLARGGLDRACDEVRWRVQQGEVEWRAVEDEAVEWRAAHADGGKHDDGDEHCDELALCAVLAREPAVALVYITDTMTPYNAAANAAASAAAPPARRSAASAARLYNIASRTHGIPTNTTDMPPLCDFTPTATHRFRSAATGAPTALQIGVVTNAKGCRLSSRLTREIVARLPPGVGDAVDNVGRLRARARAHDTALALAADADCDRLPATPNEPVAQRPAAPDADAAETPLARTQRRMQWTAQVSEYWPLEALAALDDTEIGHILSGSAAPLPRAVVAGERALALPALAPPSAHHAGELVAAPPRPAARGRIFLLGSGPGHPALLTLATLRALQTADLVLSDKLVPEGVLRVIPSHIELRIARKFPGNADRAQDELMHAALAAAQQGKTVVRLKQGDPMLYARASAELAHFAAHGFAPTVVPGLSAALAAPLAAGIPVTARGVADGVAICTGVGRGGADARVPRYARATTLLVLMGVARLGALVRALRDAGYPPHVPAAVVERATMPDQRVVRAPLGGLEAAMADARVGAQRPPGMVVVGWACLGVAEGVEGVADDGEDGDEDALRERDLARVRQWLGGERFTVTEGLDETWRGL